MKYILIALLALSANLSAQSFDFSCAPQYDNDCNCDPSGSYSGFLATPGEYFDIGSADNIGISATGNFDGSIHSDGNEVYAAIYALTGFFVAVGDTVYGNDGNHIPEGVYTRENTTTVSGVRTRTPWNYTIGANGIVSSIVEFIPNDVTGAWSDWMPFFTTQRADFQQTRVREVIIIGSDDRLPTVDTRTVLVVEGGYNTIYQEADTNIDYNTDGDLLDSQSILTRTYTARIPGTSGNYGFEEYHSVPVMNDVVPTVQITGTIRSYAGNSWHATFFQMTNITAPEGGSVSFSNGIANFTGGGYYNITVRGRFPSRSGGSTSIGSYTNRVLISDNGAFNIKFTSTRPTSAYRYVIHTSVENGDPNYVIPTGTVTVDMSNLYSSGSYHLEYVNAPSGYDEPIVNGLSFTYTGETSYSISIAGTNSKGQSFSGLTRTVTISEGGDWRFVVGNTGSGSRLIR